MKMKLLVFIYLIFYSSQLWAVEKLLYAVRTEQIERYPYSKKTQIFSADADKKESKLVFSDENTSLSLLAKRGMPSNPADVLVSSKNKVFAHAVERSLDKDKWYNSKASIYELYMDGRNQFRKVFDVLGEQSLSEMFVNPAGTKIGYINYLDQKTFIFIHETNTGKLLNEIDVSKIFLDCFTSSIGWMPDGNSLYFTLVTGDEHVTSEESYKKVGSYLIKDDGKDLVKLPESLVLFPLPKDSWRGSADPPEFIGSLPEDIYIFKDIKSKKGEGRQVITSTVIYSINIKTKSKEEMPLKISGTPYCLKISFSGKKLSFIEKLLPDGLENLWIKDLKSEEESKVFSFSQQPFKSYFGVVGWLEE